MKLCFVLPKFTRQPIGGYKIVFEYANRLADSGMIVSIAFVNNDALTQFHLPKTVKKYASAILTHIEPRWFSLDKRIKKFSIFKEDNKKLLFEQDILIATGYQTVEIVKQSPADIKKIYFIQGYETWNSTDDYIHKTYGYGFTNIVVSKWLKEIVDKYSLEESILLQNPIDTNIYKVTNDIAHRNRHTIALLYHTEEIKGYKYAFEALLKLKEKYSDLKVEMFGMFPEPEKLPNWIIYTRGASQKKTVEIYNSASVFICASIEEGFGLTGFEAMACGAALVSTSYLGVHEYAIDGYNALLSEPKDVEALVSNVSVMFDNVDDRIRIASNGVSSVKKRNWDNAMKIFKEVLKH